MPPNSKEYDRAYYQKHRKKRIAGVLRTRKPERHRARNLVYRAIKKGILLKKPCKFCSSDRAEARHLDYSRPLEVVWVCRPCSSKLRKT